MSNIGNKETFARNLLYYLERSKKSQKEVAEYIGVTPASLNEWTKAKKYPRIDKIELLARYFGILKSDLIEEKGNNRTSPTLDLQHFASNELKLTEEEEALVELFRRIPENKQEVVLEMIRLALKTQA